MQRTRRGGTDVVQVEVRPGLWRMLPTWMTDVAVCGNMSLGLPQVSVAALNELRAVLSQGSTQRTVGALSDKKEKSDETTVKNNTQTVADVSLSRVRPTDRRKQ